MKSMELVKFMAKACMYAQEHIDDPQAWSTKEESRAQLLQCVSYQMACFLAQNTKHGDEGVEWAIVYDELIEHPMKTEKKWVNILNKKADMYGGWK